MKLTEILTHPDGKTLEFKRDLSSLDGMLRSLSAFANTADAILLVGVEDGTLGKVCRTLRLIPKSSPNHDWTDPPLVLHKIALYNFAQ